MGGGGGAVPPLELSFFLPVRELLLRPLLDHYKNKTWYRYEYEEKSLASPPRFAPEVREVKWSQNAAPKGRFLKVLKLREKWTRILSNCLGKCEIGKK